MYEVSCFYGYFSSHCCCLMNGLIRLISPYATTHLQICHLEIKFVQQISELHVSAIQNKRRSMHNIVALHHHPVTLLQFKYTFARSLARSHINCILCESSFKSIDNKIGTWHFWYVCIIFCGIPKCIKLKHITILYVWHLSVSETASMKL